MMHIKTYKNLHSPFYMQQNNLHFTSECQLFYIIDNTFLRKCFIYKRNKR